MHDARSTTVHHDEPHAVSEPQGKRGRAGGQRCNGGAIVHDEFLCHVTAYGICGGRRIGVPLGTYRAPTLALALWWMRDRAPGWRRGSIRNPRSPTLPNLIAPVADTVPDVPSVLRAWCGDTLNRSWSPRSWPPESSSASPPATDTTEYELLAESVDALRMQRTAAALGSSAA